MESLTLNSQIDHLLYSTTRIEADLADGSRRTGTGFFMAFFPEPTRTDQYFPVLVTNRHVVDEAVAGRVLLHEAHVRADGQRQPSGKRIYSEIADFSSAWVGHPDPEIDLVGTPMGKVLLDLERFGHPLFFMQIGENLIPSEAQLGKLGVMEDVVVVGYPQGLADEAHGFPLFRHGYTASHPAIDFDDRPWGALDIALFSGSSGSPVLAYRPGRDYTVREGAPAPLLLGVLFGGPQARAEGFVIDAIPTRDRADVEVSLFMNIGYYVKARQLVELREALLQELGIKGRSRFPARE